MALLSIFFAYSLSSFGTFEHQKIRLSLIFVVVRGEWGVVGTVISLIY